MYKISQFKTDMKRKDVVMEWVGRILAMSAALLIGAGGLVEGAACAAYFRYYGALNGRVELWGRGDMRHYLGKTEVREAGEQRYYDEYGRYLGKAEADGAKVKYYDDYGRYVGCMERRDGGRILYYDDYGRYLGYAERRDGGRIRYYDDYGRLRGASEQDGGRIRFSDDYGRYVGGSEVE